MFDRIPGSVRKIFKGIAFAICLTLMGDRTLKEFWGQPGLSHDSLSILSALVFVALVILLAESYQTGRLYAKGNLIDRSSNPGWFWFVFVLLSVFCGVGLYWAFTQ